MPIYVGTSTKNQSTIKVGAKDVSRVYHGQTLKWQKGPLLKYFSVLFRSEWPNDFGFVAHIDCALDATPTLPTYIIIRQSAESGTDWADDRIYTQISAEGGMRMELSHTGDYADGSVSNQLTLSGFSYQGSAVYCNVEVRNTSNYLNKPSIWLAPSPGQSGNTIQLYNVKVSDVLKTLSGRFELTQVPHFDDNKFELQVSVSYPGSITTQRMFHSNIFEGWMPLNDSGMIQTGYQGDVYWETSSHG